MSETIDKARRMIEERLSELEDEAKKLRDALIGLGHRDGKPAKAVIVELPPESFLPNTRHPFPTWRSRLTVQTSAPVLSVSNPPAIT